MQLFTRLDDFLATKPKGKLEYHLRFRAADGRQTFRFTKKFESLTALPSGGGNELPPSTVHISSEDESKPAGPQVISLVINAQLSPARIRAIHDQATALAREHGVEFLDIGCREPGPAHQYSIDWPNHKQWRNADSFIWFLRHFSSTGQMQVGKDRIHIMFAFDGPDDRLASLNHTLTARGISTNIRPNLLLAHVETSSADEAIKSLFTQFQDAAEKSGVQLKGAELCKADPGW